MWRGYLQAAGIPPERGGDGAGAVRLLAVAGQAGPAPATRLDAAQFRMGKNAKPRQFTHLLGHQPGFRFEPAFWGILAFFPALLSLVEDLGSYLLKFTGSPLTQFSHEFKGMARNYEQ